MARNGVESMRKLLDALFSHKKLSFIIPLLSAVVMYLLFIVFVNRPDKLRLAVMTPIVTLICFFGVFLVVFAQVKNRLCPEWFLNLVELLILVIFCLFSIVSCIWFLINPFQNYSEMLCSSMVTWSAVCWAHSKRQ